MYFDNQKTFLRSNNELKRCLKEQDEVQIETKLALQEVEWKFTNESLFDGTWERLVQITKRTILKVLGSQKRLLDFFIDSLTETEAILNYRPPINVVNITDKEEPITLNPF